MLQNEDIQTLIDLGFTFLQAKVYLTLVKTGHCTIRKIAEKAGIARQEAQRVTAELQEIGLVEKMLISPTEFEPIPLKVAIAFLLERREKALLELKGKIGVLLGSFANNHLEILKQENTVQFVITSGKEAIIRKSKKVLDRTDKSCDIINGSWKNVGYAGSLFKEGNIQALKRNVKIRIIAEKLPNQLSVQKIYKHCLEDSHFQIRFVPHNLMAMLGIYDQEELLVTTSPKKLLGDSPMLWTNNAALVTAAQAYFNMLWKQEAKSFDHSTSEISMLP